MSSRNTTFDMHVHTKYSKDSALEPEDIIKTCRKKRLSGVAVTDHDTIRGGLETKKIAGDIDVIVAAEMKTDYGEIIGYHLNEEIKSRRIEEVIDGIKQQGGYVSVPHPFDTLRKSSIDQVKLREVVKRLDFVEGMNGRSLWFFNRRAKRFAGDNGIPILAGSDAHMKFEVGNCFTVFTDAEKMKVAGIVSRVSPLYPFYPLVRTKIRKTFRI